MHLTLKPNPRIFMLKYSIEVSVKLKVQQNPSKLYSQFLTQQFFIHTEPPNIRFDRYFLNSQKLFSFRQCFSENFSLGFYSKPYQNLEHAEFLIKFYSFVSLLTLSCGLAINKAEQMC